MNRGLFVPHQDVLEGVLLENFVVDIQNRATRIAKDVLDALGLQAAHDDLGARDGAL